MSDEVFDKKKFNVTYGSFGKEAIIDIINTYFNIYDDYLKNLKKSIEDKNIETLSKYALKFEGALNALFAIESKKFAYKLKMKGRRNDTEGIDELFIKFKEAVEKFNNELKVFVDNL